MAWKGWTWALFLLPALLIGTAGEQGATGFRRSADNIILIAVDTLAAQHLSFMGYERETCPFLHDLADRSVVFSRAYCPRATTQPSFVSLFSGCHPLTHRVLENGTTLPDDVRFLVDDFRSAGFTTWGVPAFQIIGARYGMNRGFDYYANAPPVPHPASRIMERVHRILEGSPRYGEPTFSNVSGPLFLFIHFYDPHTDYTPDPAILARFADPYYGGPVDGGAELLLQYNDYEVELDDADLRHVCDLYDAEIRTLDDSLRELFDLFERVGLLDSSIIVFTADHGENLGEHHYITHGRPYEAGLHIPLLIHFPHDLGAGKRVDALVENTDTLPTLMELFGIPIPGGVDGHSLLPLIEDSARQSDCWRAFLLAVGGVEKNGRRVGGVFDGAHRLIAEESPLLYDIWADPKETRNLASELPDVLAHLEAVTDLMASDLASPELPKYDPETEKMLRSVGYLH